MAKYIYKNKYRASNEPCEKTLGFPPFVSKPDTPDGAASFASTILKIINDSELNN